MDKRHTDLIAATLKAIGPVYQGLEIGLGSGASLDAMLATEACARFTLVDNWLDWNGKRQVLTLPPNVQFVESDEWEFIKNCKDRYSIIVSDTDHYNAHKWWHDTYSLLAPGGVAFWHDVSNAKFPNLANIPRQMAELGIQFHVFNQTDGVDRAWRGLLMAFAKEEE